MSSLAEEKRYSYKDYIKWDNDIRYELIDGVAYAVAAPTRLHQKTSGEIFRQLANYLRGKPCEVFHAPFDVRLNASDFDDIVVQPDILVVCDESKLDNKSVKGTPDMIIEILSPSNARHDTFTKFRHYQKSGVREYWIVNPARRIVEVYILENGKYGLGIIYREDDVIPVHTLKGCKINLADVFYDIFESDEKSELKQILIDAMRADGVYTEQIQKIFDSVDII